ncbi:RING-H2 finger protein ATL7 [Linum perenne]
MLGSEMNFVATVIGFAMSVTFIIFICTRIICWKLRGGDSRPMLEIESGGIDDVHRVHLPQLYHRMNGLPPFLVAAIPTMNFTSEAFSSSQEAQCSICLGEYQEKEVLRIMPQCGHNFHLSCIDVWLRKQSTCPVCRFPVQDSLEAKHARQALLSSNLSMSDLSDHSSRFSNSSSQGYSNNNVTGAGSNQGVAAAAESHSQQS